METCFNLFSLRLEVAWAMEARPVVWTEMAEPTPLDQLAWPALRACGLTSLLFQADYTGTPSFSLDHLRTVPVRPGSGSW